MALQSAEFELEVRRLLELSGYTTGELQHGHKKVDVLLETYRFGKRRLTAVECKSSSSRLRLDETATIVAEYQPLVDARRVDEVLIVTRAGLYAAANQLVRESPAFAHMTLRELSNTVLDLSGYLRGLISRYEESPDGLSSYYIPLSVEPRRDLLELTLAWIDASRQPMAVLGAYGSGKSSFALHLAAHLAEIAIHDESARRPILIRLGDVSAEQSLEGLIGRTLAATVAVPNYSFDRFMGLNRDGRFVIVLDGFDEMKRTLSWDEFRYNLTQLNRLVVASSRVLLLGRPTAFLNDDEYEFALHGRQRFGDVVSRVPDWPDFRTHRLAPFMPFEIRRFLDGYLRYAAGQRAAPTRKEAGRGRAAAERAKRLDATIAYQIRRVETGHLKEIAKRPVQLKMLAEVLPEWRGSLDRLDTTHLFDSFIDRIIERDAEKLTRTRFTTQERRAFATRLAWWMWTTTSSARVTPDEIPRALIEPFCAPGENLDAVRRDLVAACFLDRTHGGPLVFPHRSFQEFLVAAHAVDELTSDGGSIAEVDGALNREVAEFMYEMIGPEDLGRIDGALTVHRGVLSHMLVRLFYRTPASAEWLALRSFRRLPSPWHVQLLTLAVIEGAVPPTLIRAADVLKLLGTGAEPDYALLVWRCIMQLSHATRDAGLIEAGLASLIASGRDLRAGSARRQQERALVGRTEGAVEQVLRFATVNPKRRTVDLRGTYRTLAGRLTPYCWIAGTRPEEGLPSLPVALQDPGLVADLHEYLEARRS